MNASNKIFETTESERDLGIIGIKLSKNKRNIAFGFKLILEMHVISGCVEKNGFYF